VFSRTITAPAYPASPYSGSLGAYAGQSVKLRWRLSSDAGVVGKGWWVDDIAITNTVIPGACVSGGSPSVQEASPAGDMHASRGAGTSVDVTYAPACGSLDQAIYWGAGPFAGSAVWTNVACGLGSSGHALFDPGDPAADSFYYFVVVGQRAASEGSYGTATSGERPEASGFGACDKPQVLGGSCP
jgi:hypothetical protein